MNNTEQGRPGNAAPSIDSPAAANQPTASPLLDACEKALMALNTAPRTMRHEADEFSFSNRV